MTTVWRRWRDHWTDPSGIIAETILRAEHRLRVSASERAVVNRELMQVQHLLDTLQREQEAELAALHAEAGDGAGRTV